MVFTAEKQYHTGTLMKDLWFHLVRDFRTVCGPGFLRKEEALLSVGIKDFRQVKWPNKFLAPYFAFKAEYQLEHLFKRFIFDNDLYEDDDIKKTTLGKFVDTQVRVSSSYEISYRSRIVIRKARSIARKILMDYNVDEHVKHCQFAKRATVGNSARDSYLDSKIGFSLLTGSSSHIDWFQRTYLPGDEILRDIIGGNTFGKACYDACDSLSLTMVPKSFKAFRVIMPNTTIGSLYSFGLGDVMMERLKMYGLNVRRLQEKHKHLAQRYSKSRSHVTADLSSASDSITSQLVNMVLPRSWFRALNFGRLRYCTVGGQRIFMETFCTMGIGFTFPLQTVIFYSLLESIRLLLGIKGSVSVYGDDLIYPTGMHLYVRQIFDDLKLLINEEKTFVGESFRESCGGDYYCGFDVRPFQPEGRASNIRKHDVAPFIYKCINGLLERWLPEEIPITLSFLKDVILETTPTLFQVPPYMPVNSGIRVDSIQTGQFWSPVSWNLCKQMYDFHYFATQFRLRKVSWQLPLYWNCLRLGDVGMEEENDPYSSPTDVLIWRRIKCKRWRSFYTGIAFRYKLQAFYQRRMSVPRITVSSDSTAHWK